jgi:hypothetical protein
MDQSPVSRPGAREREPVGVAADTRNLVAQKERLIRRLIPAVTKCWPGTDAAAEGHVELKQLSKRGVRPHSQRYRQNLPPNLAQPCVSRF